MIPILIFFFGHWILSVFCQTFFLHRYGAHRMFKMSKGWERFFHLLTYLAQGTSYLNPRGYAILHRMHHAFSDTEHDPHSPLYYKNVLVMMWQTKHRYGNFVQQRVTPEARFDGGTPVWPRLDRLGRSWLMRFVWISVYIGFYAYLAPSSWWYLLLPAHFVMGPIHGAIVNWCGHRYGYSNYDNGDESKNTLALDFLTLGELFQNNHHKFSSAPNFAARRFEIDLTYQVMRLLHWMGIIEVTTTQRMRYPAPNGIGAEPATRDLAAG